MSKTIVVISIFLLASFGAAAQLEDISVENIFFCNQTENISNIYLLSDSTALGVRLQEKPNWHVKDIVLINNGLLIDSLSLNKLFNVPQGLFMSVRDVVVESNKATILSSRKIIEVSIVLNKIVVDSVHKSTGSLKLKKSEISIASRGLLPLKGYRIGYKRKKIKRASNNKSIKDSKNYPEFFVISKATGDLIQINESEEIVTNDLFLDTNDLDVINDKTNVFHNYASYHSGSIYFNVCRANKCYVFNTTTNNVSSFNFPEVEDGQSCFYYYDQYTKKEYVVRKEGKNDFVVFIYSDNYKIVTRVAEIDFLPVAIVNGKLHQIKDVKENHRKFKCHYMIPINDDESKKVTTLDDVEIN